MVEQYRKALEKSIIEIPAGKLEPGEEPIKRPCVNWKKKQGTDVKISSTSFRFIHRPDLQMSLFTLYRSRYLSNRGIKRNG